MACHKRRKAAYLSPQLPLFVVVIFVVCSFSSLPLPTIGFSSVTLSTPTPTRRRQHRHNNNRNNIVRFDQNQQEKEKGGGSPLDFLFNPYESKIPKEIEKDIYEAEGNTAAAKDRGKRIVFYAIIAFIGVGCAFFNGFLTELRTSVNPDTEVPFVLEDSSFAWVTSNFLFKFAFLNKIGGGLSLLLGGGAGLLAEAEFDSRRINAEKIWEEMQNRRSSAAEKSNKKLKKQQNRKKKRRSGKESKRMSALSEVVQPADDTSAAADVIEPSSSSIAAEKVEEGPQTTISQQEPKEDGGTEYYGQSDGGGILDGIKDFYDKADKMAQTQALLLNKKLEDDGLIEKVTDESGLKVIGREAAAKAKKDQLKEKE